MKWSVAKYGDPYSEFVLCIYPIQVHTHSSEHALPEQWAAILLRRPGSSWWFGALLKVLTSVVEESALHSLPPPTIPAGPETRTRNLWVTSPTLYPLGHDCLLASERKTYKCIFNKVRCKNSCVHAFSVLIRHCSSLVKHDSTILTPKDGLRWRKLLVKLAPSFLY